MLRDILALSEFLKMHPGQAILWNNPAWGDQRAQAYVYADDILDLVYVNADDSEDPDTLQLMDDAYTTASSILRALELADGMFSRGEVDTGRTMLLGAMSRMDTLVCDVLQP